MREDSTGRRLAWHRRRLNRIWPVGPIVDVIEEEMERRHIVPRPAYVAASSASSGDEGFSWWPLKLILGIVAVVIGAPLIGVLAQMGGFFIVALIMVAVMSAAMRGIF